MKRNLLLTALLALFAFSASANIEPEETNLVVNGDLSTWTDDTTPQGWDKVENCVKNDADYHSAPYSVTHTGGTKDLAQTVPVTGGKTYTISFFYKLQTVGDSTDSRIWSSWKTGSDYAGDALPELQGPGGSSGYLPTVTEWTKYEVVLTAPADADNLNFEVRTYSGAVTLWDDFSVVEVVSTTPSLYAPTSLDGFGYVSGNTSNENSFILSAENLSDDAVVTAPANYEVSLTSGSAYASSVNVTPTSGEIAGTMVYVRLKENLSEGEYLENLTITASGAADVEVALDGQVFVAYQSLPYVEDFETGAFAANWTVYADSGTVLWGIKSYNNNHYAYMGSYGSGEKNLNGIATPLIDLDATDAEVLSFDVESDFYKGGESLEVIISTNYDGTNRETATWINVTENFTIPQSSSYGTLVSAGTMDLSALSGKLTVVFQYSGDDTSDPAMTGTFRIDNVKVEEVVPVAPSLITMEKSDYQIIVDTVNARGWNTETSFASTTENYFGISSYYGNFKLTNYNDSVFASADTAIEVALSTILLPALADVAVVDDTITVEFAMYGGDFDNGVMDFVCTSVSPLTFERIADITAPEWVDAYPAADDITGDAFTLYFKASESTLTYGAMYDTLPATTPTKAEIKARAQSGDNAYILSVGTEEYTSVVNDMESEHTYYVYVYMSDAAGNESDVVMISATTLPHETYSVVNLLKDDYQLIVDTVNAWGINTHKYSGNSENYFGASAFNENFDVRDGSYDSLFVTADSAIEVALSTVFLPAAKTKVEVGDTVEVNYAMYGGEASQGAMYFECTAVDPITFVRYQDKVAPEWADGYPMTGNLKDYSFDLMVKGSEVCTAYGALFDTMPAVAPTKAEIMARVEADDNAGVIPVSTVENSMTIEVERPEHTYYLYMYLVDEAGNESAEVVSVSATTLEASKMAVFAGEDFQKEAVGPFAKEGWINGVQSGSSDGWEVSIYDGNAYAQFSSYKGTGEDSVYLITPNVDLSVATGNVFTFDVNTGYYNAPCLNVYISEDYDGVEPGNATWVDITSNFTFPTENTSGYGLFASAGTMSLDTYAGNVAFCFEYVGNGEDSRTSTFQIDNIAIAGVISNMITVNGVSPLADVTIDQDMYLVDLDMLVMSGKLPTELELLTDTGNTMVPVEYWLDGSAAYDGTQTGTYFLSPIFAVSPFFDVDAVNTTDLQKVVVDVAQTVFVPESKLMLDLTFEEDLEGCDVVQVEGETGWYADSYGYAKIGTFGKGANESWLVTPPVNVDALVDPLFLFEVASYNDSKTIADCGAEQFEVYYSANPTYGQMILSEWTRFESVDTVMLAARWDFVPVSADISSVAGEAVYFAFRHKSNDSNGTTWEVDNVFVGSAADTVSAGDPEITGFTALTEINIDTNIYLLTLEDVLATDISSTCSQSRMFSPVP